MGTWAINQGNARCGPGAKATSVQEAVAADNIAWGSRSGAAAGGRASGRVSPVSSIGGARPASEASAGGQNSGRSSPTMSTGGIDDDSSPAGSGSSRKVPPLGGLVTHMGSLSIPTLAQSAGVTTEEADYFLKAGFTADEVQTERTVAMMTVLLDKRPTLQRDGHSVEDYVDELGDDEDAQLPGVDGVNESVMFDLLDLYGVGKRGFRSLPDSNWFHCGRPVERVTPGKVQVTKRVARLLVLGAGVTNSGLSAAGQTSISGSTAARGARAMSGMDPSRAASRASGNRGRKTRAKTNKLAEEGLDSFMERQVAQAQKLADQKHEEDERRRAAENKRELGRRQELVDMMAHERAMREDERKHDRQEREEERAAARADQKADRDHQIKMMQLQVDLAKAKGNNN
ncbi:hypothetical protein Esi_0354_0019 [Ectocarpus siliculosus]|uniref:Uncharacterized protein n=1 Tax=Ectocarpus siliculosus TaxID=2880 RepID=D7FZ43_ECTSI|nr:hypothetical protein Esi_0354_0019 [Ectocarpus siliculosus]|eukprot:CBJ32660.1 hypothetical protein Esi_0354_0019 [Ectocarpus siliculosus]